MGSSPESGSVGGCGVGGGVSVGGSGLLVGGSVGVVSWCEIFSLSTGVDRLPFASGWGIPTFDSNLFTRRSLLRVSFCASLLLDFCIDGGPISGLDCDLVRPITAVGCEGAGFLDRARDCRVWDPPFIEALGGISKLRGRWSESSGLLWGLYCWLASCVLWEALLADA